MVLPLLNVQGTDVNTHPRRQNLISQTMPHLPIRAEVVVPGRQVATVVEAAMAAEAVEIQAAVETPAEQPAV